MGEMDWFATELALLEEAFERRLEPMPAAPRHRRPESARAARHTPPDIHRSGRRGYLHWLCSIRCCKPRAAQRSSSEHARHATVAHLFLLAHAFADDHLIDGQTGLTSEDFVFVKEALLEAVEDPRRGAGCRRHCRGKSCGAHCGVIIVRRSSDSTVRPISRRALIADRAALGGVAGRVLVRAARYPERAGRRDRPGIRRAGRRAAVGLPYLRLASGPGERVRRICCSHYFLVRKGGN